MGPIFDVLQKIPHKLQVVLKSLDRIFLSVPLAIFLILLFCLVSILGTFISSLSLFQAGWFLFLLLYIGMAMVYCTLRRLPDILKLYFNPQGKIEKLYTKREFFRLIIPQKDKQKTISFLDRILRKSGYRRRSYLSQDKDEGSDLYEKVRFSIFGSHIVHFAIAVILVAGVITVVKGKFYDLDIKEGESVNVNGTDTKITLEKFSLIPSGDKTVADEYASRLRINRPDTAPVWRTLKVNYPVEVDGFRLYQIRYTYDIEKLNIAIYKGSKERRPIVINTNINERTDIPQLDITIEVKDFIPDFAIDKEGSISSRSEFLKNPAAYIVVYPLASSKKIIQEGWVFRNFLTPHNDKEESPVWKFAIDDVRIKYTSGIKFTRDPARGLTHFGLILLVIGSFLSCYRFYRCLLVSFDTGKDGDNIRVSCFAYETKNMFEFIRELKQIKEKLDKAFSNL